MEPICSLTDQELVKRCDEWVTKLCDTGGKAWTLRVPVDISIDPDMLFIEMGKRLLAKQVDGMNTIPYVPPEDRTNIGR